jgi:hypothetical protein
LHLQKGGCRGREACNESTTATAMGERRLLLLHCRSMRCGMTMDGRSAVAGCGVRWWRDLLVQEPVDGGREPVIVHGASGVQHDGRPPP